MIRSKTALGLYDLCDRLIKTKHDFVSNEECLETLDFVTGLQELLADILTTIDDYGVVNNNDYSREDTGSDSLDLEGDSYKGPDMSNEGYWDYQAESYEVGTLNVFGITSRMRWLLQRDSHDFNTKNLHIIFTDLLVELEQKIISLTGSEPKCCSSILSPLNLGGTSKISCTDCGWGLVKIEQIDKPLIDEIEQWWGVYESLFNANAKNKFAKKALLDHASIVNIEGYRLASEISKFRKTFYTLVYSGNLENCPICLNKPIRFGKRGHDVCAICSVLFEEIA